MSNDEISPELYEIGARHGRSRAEVDAFLTPKSSLVPESGLQLTQPEPGDLGGIPVLDDMPQDDPSLHDAVAPVAFIGKAKEELIQLVSRLDQAMDTLVPQDDPRGKDRQFWDFAESESEEPDGYAFSPDHVALMEWVQKRLANDRILGPDDRHACAEKLRIALEDRVPLMMVER